MSTVDPLDLATACLPGDDEHPATRSGRAVYLEVSARAIARRAGCYAGALLGAYVAGAAAAVVLSVANLRRIRREAERLTTTTGARA